jgi:hypothetical protein
VTVKRYPPSELPPDNGRYQVSDGEQVYIASCVTYNLDGKPTVPNWVREGEHNGTRDMIWWARLPKAGWPRRRGAAS